MSQTALWCAEGHEHFVRLLLEHGANASLCNVDAHGSSPLAIAAWMGHTSTVSLLLAAGADVKQIDMHGRCPLASAARQGHTDALGLLLEAGADIDNRPGECVRIAPLHAAAETGQTAAVRQLLAAGADIDQTDHIGQTALILAAAFGHAEPPASCWMLEQPLSTTPPKAQQR